ncbi:hypothetical protein RJ639_038808 [Escallonia herrerae]|uniref:Peptidase S8/S53 domain-containing protein n=1 Tax=Escallonia herrerae TaxID=1293975 RepID=A0AA88WNI1_9ASTE|nr:hypothetical protein RJ639_038808 [Escallonia herrerae]
MHACALAIGGCIKMWKRKAFKGALYKAMIHSKASDSNGIGLVIFRSADMQIAREELYKELLLLAKYIFNDEITNMGETIAEMKEVISVFESKTMQLHTTRSWDFMGLTLDFSSEVTPLQLAYGDDIVVGIFDTGLDTFFFCLYGKRWHVTDVFMCLSMNGMEGIWPESESFQEEPDLGHVSRSWKGECVQGEKFDPAKACNQKLIGARFYYKGFEEAFGPLEGASGNLEYKSARGYLGHGTHTASTAVGSIVKNASFLNLGQGVARGGAPRARLAVYKVCWSLMVDNNTAPDDKCTDADVIKAFDDALHDGVHVISASFGSTPPTAPFWNFSADIGSFHAMQKGVSVVFSAGNDGPDPSLVTNVAPWSICVAASSLDRAFPAQIILDNNISFTGESLIGEAISDARLVGARRYFDQGICKLDRWNNRTATRRDVVLCFSTIGSVEGGEAVEAVSKAKASGLIFVEPLSRQIADVDAIPTVRIDIIQGTKIRHYLAQSRSLPKVQILPSKAVIKKSPAPKVAYFSSRGPSSLSPDILKICDMKDISNQNDLFAMNSDRQTAATQGSPLQFV